jgi:hypothetical protein
MARNLIRSAVLLVTIMAGFIGVSFYEKNSHDAQLAKKDEIIKAEQLKNELLKGVVKRLQTDKRVARIIVTDQKTENGQTWTTLLFGEYARDGSSYLENAEKMFTIEGKGAHIDAYVIEFEGKFVEENEALRGHSIALFKRIFGDKQTPEGGFVIDSPGEIPDVYKGSDPKLADMEKSLWKDFWRLADDAEYRKQWGVKLAYGSGGFREEFKKGYVYTMMLSPTGGLKLTAEKMDPMFERALEEAAKKKNP